MKLKIQKATLNDLTKIQELNLLLHKKGHAEYDKTLNCDWVLSKEGYEYFKKRISSYDSFVFIARINNNIVAYLIGYCFRMGSYRTVRDYAELETMFVLEEFQGSGIGKKLCSKFFDWCKSKGVKRVKVVTSSQNIHAIEFYRKCGFIDYELVLEKDI